MSDIQTFEEEIPRNEFAVADWDSYIGQEKAKKLLKLKIAAAAEQGKALHHQIITGPSGSGKSSLAALIAQDLQCSFVNVEATASFDMGAFINLLIKLDLDFGGGVCFIDEVHQLKRTQQHYLYSILLEKAISLDDGEKYYFKNPLTIIAATTDPQKLSKSLMQRFDLPIRLREYDDEEMTTIVQNMCEKAGVQGSIEDYEAIALASAGSPRQATPLVRLARDLKSIDMETMLDLTSLTADGLTIEHTDYLEALYDLGSTVGLESIANIAMRNPQEIKDCEPLLLKRGYIAITKKGRMLTLTGLTFLRDFRNEK